MVNIPRIEDIPEYLPGYHLIKKGDILLWWAMAKHFHVYEVVYKQSRISELDLKLVKCIHDKELMDRISMDMINKFWEPCEVGKIRTLPWLMIHMNYEKSRMRWLSKTAEKVLFGV